MSMAQEVFVRGSSSTFWSLLSGVGACALALAMSWSTIVPVAFAQAGPALQASVPINPADDLAVGVIVDSTNPRSMQLAQDAGFGYAKMIIQWGRLEPKRGQYTFANSDQNDLDNVIRAAQAEGLKLVLRVDGAPDWVGGAPVKAGADAIEAFYAAMAAHGKGTIAAYEVLNEPNLPFEWGGAPSPSGYANFVKAAYRGVKKGDPGALVIGGGLSPAAGGGGSMDDFEFLRGTYAAGVRGSMDALAVHNYGGNFEPEQDPANCGICFRRAETYRQIMVDQGDVATPIWSTEFGWLLDPGRNMGQYDWMRVSADKQADYLVRAFRYARANWPWIGGMIVSNLDASTSGNHTGAQDGMPWFALLNKDYSPRPAWKAFKSWREQDKVPAASRQRSSSGPSGPPVAPMSEAAALANGPGNGQPVAVQPVAVQSVADQVTTDPPALPTPTPIPTATVLPAATLTPITIPSATTEPSATPTTPTPTLPVPDVVPTATYPAPIELSTPTTPGMPATRVRVAGTDGTGVNLRLRPRIDAESLGVLPDGTLLDVVGDDVIVDGRTWRNVRTLNGTKTGWVSAQYLSSP
jgi:hypothetical protein